MVLILWSLSVFLPTHARHPLSASAALPIDLCELTLAVESPRGMSDAIGGRIVEEAAAIWKPLGVAVHAAPAGAATIRIVIGDDVDARASERMPLGWIRFPSPGRPEPLIHLSRVSALRLLDSTAALQRLPTARRDLLFERILGRALAHELGHYLLASTRHAGHGLMRSSWPVDSLIAEETNAFELTSDEARELKKTA